MPSQSAPSPARQGLPVLLAASGDDLPTATRTALQDLHSVTLVGGAAAISTQLDAQIAGLGVTVERIAGPSRLGTAVGWVRRRRSVMVIR